MKRRENLSGSQTMASLVNVLASLGGHTGSLGQLQLGAVQGTHRQSQATSARCHPQTRDVTNCVAVSIELYIRILLQFLAISTKNVSQFILILIIFAHYHIQSYWVCQTYVYFFVNLGNHLSMLSALI